MNRKDQREWILKLVYENLANSNNSFNTKQLESHNLIDKKIDFIEASLKSLYDNYDQINNIMINNVDSTAIKKLSLVDKALILISINEMFYLNIPSSVSINEAVELSKTYSADNSYKVVNGILGVIYRKYD
ncbi:MAG: transcription antitermination factor NusB [Tissierellia bacterium]|nr:transcription antitermination factor NusB [Tissierellia bacterium]